MSLINSMLAAIPEDGRQQIWWTMWGLGANMYYFRLCHKRALKRCPLGADTRMDGSKILGQWVGDNATPTPLVASSPTGR